MGSKSCVPVKVALQLNDSSSLGLMEQYDQFQETHRQLENALKLIVNEHHQGFNSSIGTFHTIQAAIHASQHRVRTLRAGLVAAKGSLASTRPELKAFAQGSQGYDQMLHVLGTIEQLQAVPEKLEAEISEKRFLAAVDTLQDALKLIRKPEVEEIGALSDLRLYLSNQEHSVTDILIEELHSHLYLKSPYCEERWKSHAKRDGASGGVASEERAMHSFLDNYDGTKPMQEDTARNPEADTFYYIQLLVESLNRMSRLDVAVDAIEQRLPVELFRVVERSHSEVEQRHPSTLRAGTQNRPETLSVTMNEGPEGERKATLEDLLVTLFAKFEAIAEGHSVMHSVIASILKREGLLDGPTLNRSFKELWKLLQSEIRSLLHDHLATSGNLSNRSGKNNDASANIFKQKPRDRSRRLFKLSNTDSRSTELATEQEDLEYILKASVPGLVNAGGAESKKHRDDAMPDRSATGHKLLVEPSVFNMGILLPPCLSFLTRLREVVPKGSNVVPSTLTSFLDDFLINIFYPQLDETLLELCSHSLNDIDAFQPDVRWQQYAQKPIFKGVVQFYHIIEGVCRMLDALPHDQSFSQLVITQMRTYYDRCFNWSKSLLQRAQNYADETPRMRLAADLATSGAIQQPVIDLMTESDPTTTTNLIDEETVALLALAEERQIEPADLLHDRKSLAALCTLHTSMKWLAARCKNLRFISPRALDTSNPQTSTTSRWSHNHTKTSQLPTTGPYLPLDAPTAEQFDAVLFSYTELSSLILRTLHIDLRLHLLSGLTSALRTTYALEQPYNDPDPAVLTLSSSLSTYTTTMTSHLLPAQILYLVSHLDRLANSALIELVTLVPAMDKYGQQRMGLNVAVLQQSLKDVYTEGSLERARKFYELADEGLAQEEVVERVGREDFDAAAVARLGQLTGRFNMVVTSAGRGDSRRK